MKKSFLSVLSFVLLVFPLSLAHGQVTQIPILNSSFESPAAPLGFNDTVDAWVEGPGNPAGVAVFGPVQFSTPLPDSNQAALIKFCPDNNCGANPFPGVLYQDLAASYQAGETYTLSFYAGIRLDENPSNYLQNSTLSLRRSDTGDLLAGLTFNESSFSARGVFQQFSVAFTATPQLDGVGIRIQIEKDLFGTQLVFDKVSLTVPATPQEQIADLRNAVEATPALNSGDTGSLVAKLDAASASVDRGNENAARGQLGAFVNQVKALIRSRRLTQAEGQPLIDVANAIIAAL